MAKLNFQSSVSHDPSEIILKCWNFYIVNVKNDCAAWHFCGSCDESSKEQHLFETDYFTFDQFIASLLNKSNNFFQKIPTEHSFLNYLSTTFEVF